MGLGFQGLGIFQGLRILGVGCFEWSGILGVGDVKGVEGFRSLGCFRGWGLGVGRPRARARRGGCRRPPGNTW